MKKKRLGEILRERNQVSADDLNKAIQDQPGKLMHLGELLLGRGVVSKEDLVVALTELSRVAYVDVQAVSIDESTLSLIPGAMAKRCCALPLEVNGTKLIVALAEPQNLQLIDELRFKSGMIIEPRMGFRTELEAAIEKFYGPSEPVLGPTDDRRNVASRTAPSTSETRNGIHLVQFARTQRRSHAGNTVGTDAEIKNDSRRDGGFPNDQSCRRTPRQ